MLTFALKKKRIPSIAPKRHTPAVSPMSHSLHLQQAKVRHILRGPTLQPKLTIGVPNDKYEQEADRVADEVMRMPEPRLQRQVEPEEEEEPIQTKQTGGQTSQVSPSLEVQIQSLKGRGKPLPESDRAFFEPRFGYDFSRVRMHTDVQAAESAQAVNARAYTVGQDVVFGAGQYTPKKREGQRLLAHELAHVVQQQRSQEGSGRIQRWVASEHGRITKEVISSQYAGDLSSDAMLHSAYYSGEMDLRGCNYLWYLPPKIKKVMESVPIIGPIVGKPKQLPIVGPIAEKVEEAHKYLSVKEAPNHGEANLYQKSNTDPVTLTGKRTWVNEDRMNGYAKKAAIKANKDGLNRQVFIELGQAIHVGQDRGAHDEGLAGQGHDRPGWKPDDTSVNKAGHATAKKRTKEVLGLFLSALTADRKKQLKTVVLGSLTSPSPVIIGSPVTTSSPVVDEPKLPSLPPLFYMGVTKGMFMDKSGLPVRLGGIFPPLYHTGLMYMGGKGNTIAFDQQIGLRLLRITPKVYVDVFGGGVLGVNFDDKSVMAGLSTGVHVTYTGKENDYGIMLNKIWDVVGNRNLLVIGVGGTFDESKWFK